MLLINLAYVIGGAAALYIAFYVLLVSIKLIKISIDSFKNWIKNK